MIVYIEMQKENGSTEMAFDTLRNLKCKVFDKKIMIQEMTRDQRKLFEMIGVLVPNTMWEFRKLTLPLLSSFIDPFPQRLDNQGILR